MQAPGPGLDGVPAALVESVHGDLREVRVVARREGTVFDVVLFGRSERARAAFLDVAKSWRWIPREHPAAHLAPPVAGAATYRDIAVAAPAVLEHRDPCCGDEMWRAVFNVATGGHDLDMYVEPEEAMERPRVRWRRLPGSPARWISAPVRSEEGLEVHGRIRSAH